MISVVSTDTAASPTVVCRLCGDVAELRYPGSEGWVDTSTLAPTNHEVGAHGDLYVCQRCGTVQPSELPSQELLASRYAATEDDRYLDEEPGRRRTARRLLDLLDRRVSPGPMLDIGCGHGLLMAEARDRGWDPTGLELSRSAAGHARNLGLVVLERTIEDAGLAPGSFDVITAVDLIEHLHDPQDFVRRCRELLTPGGALVIATPDPESRVARAFGRRWWAYIPAHLHLLPRRMLRELFQTEGFVVADDVAMVRDFSLRYLLAGLAGRGSRFSRLARMLERLPIPDRPLSVPLGDQRVMVAIRPS
jgi:SAM-dependent methyltransferase